MKEKGQKAAYVLLLLAGIVELVAGITEKRFSSIPIGIGFIIMGSLYFYKKAK